MNPYSVLLLYPDYMNDSGIETYYEHVDAISPEGAVLTAQSLAHLANDGMGEPEDFAALLCIAGHHKPLTLKDS
jgi:hypothetical protein